MTQDTPQWLQSLLKDAIAERSDFPAIQLAISSPHLTCKTSISNTDQISDDTPWRIASITKTFTAVAILKLAEQGKIDLHAPVVEYLPEWGIECLRKSTSIADQMSTWELLHHTSGLGHHTGEEWMKAVQRDTQHHWTIKDVVMWSADHTPSLTPGEFFYSDTGYTYLGLVIEQFMPLEKAVKFCDMPSTYWEVLESDRPRARQYFGTLDVTDWEASFDLYGAGGMVSNSEDLNTFTKALFTGKIIDTKLLCETEKTGYYGCGVVKSNFAGHEAWGHTGFWGCWTYYIPSLDMVFSGTSNQGVKPQLDLDKLVKGVIEHHMGKQ